MSIPFRLQQAIESGSAVLFIGAGMGYNMIDPDGNAIPDGQALAQKITKHFSVPTENEYDLAKISQFVVAKNKGRDELISFIKSCLSQAHPDDFMSWIPTIRWKAIFTTNYDNTIEQAYDFCESPIQQYVTITHVSGLRDYNEATDVPIIHLHGYLFSETSSDIIITSQDYSKFEEKRRSLFALLKQRMASSCILYSGYSNNDSNFNTIVSDLEMELLPFKPELSYRIDPNTSEMDQFIWKERNIETISETFTEFVKEARLQLNIQFSPKDNYKQYKQSIPDDFQKEFSNYPVPILRLMTSWQYLNQMPVLGSPDVYNYVRGNLPTWPIIFSNKYFIRSIEDEIFDQLIDYATEPKKRTRVCVITGSAGYGITTLLMTIAKRLIKENIGKVFFHSSSRELREGDVFFACNFFSDKRCFFIIDDAADYAAQLKTLITHSKQSKKDVIIIIGDRSNEIIQAKLKFAGEAFTIQSLTDVEIENLIDFLSENNELNKLKYLARDLQVLEIKKNYNRELLVAIREATEGKSFDSIIQDEFFGIKSDLAKKAYAIVSCFHQHSALLRIELLSKLLGTPLVEIYSLILLSLNGVIFYEEINKEFGEYAIRTRHRIIATIVWNSCLTPVERDNYIHSVLENLNIAYPMDKKAFDNFIRSDQLVDSLVSIESKMRFFERAIRIDPDNPYILQHYSRMLVRSKKESLALSVIETAIKMDLKNRFFYHTKGYILQHMALGESNIGVARRYVGQSEEAYQTAQRMNPKDAYCYQGLSSLYLSWAKKIDDESEQTLYLAKAEDIIEEGFKKATDKESIWIESANIDEYIGDMPNRIKSLQNAVDAAPKSQLSKYLLAKAFIVSQRYDEAKTVLKSILLETTDDYQANMEYAKVLLITGERIETGIAILEQSKLFGYSDPRFIALLGGLYFLNKDFTNSDKVFNESIRREMFNIQKVMFTPTEYGLNSFFSGTVNYVGNGYSFINIDGYKDVRCYSSKYKGTIIHRGMQLKVKVEFTPKYPVAEIVV